MLTSDPDKVSALQTYNDGKFKRLNLMFAVNGGAFAIVKLMFENSNKPLLGKLTLFHVSLGAVVFTAVMIVDTWRWCDRMRKDFLPSLAFTVPGRFALALLGLIIVTAWALAGFFNG